MNLDRVKELAHECGIDIAGVSLRYDSGRIRERLESRRKCGYQTEFEHDIDKRTDIDGILPGWRSIIAIGVSYNRRYRREGGRFKGYVTKSAVERDYHDILSDRMKELMEALKREAGDFNFFCGVDTAPLVDREIAGEAGIGFFGRNNSIINEKYGSFIFLGYIVTDMDIAGSVKDESDIEASDCSEMKGNSKVEADSHDGALKASAEQKNGCGDCRLCLDACPTKAIREGNVMNARVCISYLTQTKDKIPYDLREKMGKSLYGCDICQNVCPYNRGALPASSDEGAELSDELDLIEMINIGKKEFKERYGARAFSWRGKNIIKRNAVIALSKIDDPEAEEILFSLLKDDSPMIREYTVWSLYMKGIEAEAIAEKSGKFSEENLEEYRRIEGFYAKQ